MTSDSDDRAIWDQVFRDHADEFRTAPVTVHQKDCLHYLQTQGARTILDLGCGIGRWAVHLASHGLQVSGFDPSKPAIRTAQQWAEDRELTIDFRVGAATDEVFERHRFDAVVAAMVLDNLPRRTLPEVLRRIGQWLGPSGLFYALFNPALTPPEVEALAASPNPTTGIRTHYYSDVELEALLDGFEILERRVYDEGVRAFFMRQIPRR